MTPTVDDLKSLLAITGCELVLCAGAERVVEWRGEYSVDEWLVKVSDALEAKRQLVGQTEYIQQRQTLEAQGVQAFDQGQLVDPEPSASSRIMSAATASDRHEMKCGVEGD